MMKKWNLLLGEASILKADHHYISLQATISDSRKQSLKRDSPD